MSRMEGTAMVGMASTVGTVPGRMIVSILVSRVSSRNGTCGNKGSRGSGLGKMCKGQGSSVGLAEI